MLSLNWPGSPGRTREKALCGPPQVRLGCRAVAPPPQPAPCTLQWAALSGCPTQFDPGGSAVPAPWPAAVVGSVVNPRTRCVARHYTPWSCARRVPCATCALGCQPLSRGARLQCVCCTFAPSHRRLYNGVYAVDMRIQAQPRLASASSLRGSDPAGGLRTGPGAR